MNKNGLSTKSFRLWVLNIYQEHRKEREEFFMRPLSLKDYWLEYKHWLRMKFKDENTIKKS